MAEREDIRERTRKLNPAMVEFSEQITRLLVKHGVTNIVELTEDMTMEEQEMAIFAGLLKEGYPVEEAEKKAKDQLALLNRVFGP